MFEEEAEEKGVEYADKQKRTISIHEDSGYSWGQVEEGYENGFKDGAEFGYNKANEWHYVKDGDLPKGNGLFVIYWKLGSIDNYMTFRGTIDNPLHKDIIAWKEIVLPELPKESEIKSNIFPEITLPEGSAELVDKIIADAEKRLKENE